MNLIKTYKYKLKLTKPQSQRIDAWIGACRYVYNLALETKINAYQCYGVTLHKFDLLRQLKDLKDVDWIESVPSGSLQNVIERLDLAYKRFFKGSGFPKWAKKGGYNSILFKEVKTGLGGFILPKIGLVKIHKDREAKGILKTAIITKENNEYYICITAECESKNIYPTDESQVVGIDMGVTYFLVDSDGCFVENPRHTKKYEKKLRVESRSLARKKKGSRSRQMQKKKVANLHKKIANTRKDFLHKTSHRYVKENSIIISEDLKVANMIKFSNLSKHISDASWFMFFSMLDYKCKWYEKQYVKIPPKYTSQKCNVCGYIAKENRPTQSKFECASCGHKQNADYNASQNIKSEGIALIRQRETIVCA